MSTVVEKKVTEKVSSKDAVINSISIKAIENNVKGEKTEKQPKEVEKKATLPVPEIVQPVLTLEQKIERIENLKTLIEKREKLEASRKKLNAFVVGANQFSENIVLTDENGNSFKTSNSEVFTKVVDTIKNTLIAKISEIEQQIEL